MEKLKNNEVGKVSGGALDPNKLELIKGPLDTERTCESCGKTFICYHYNGCRPIGNIFDRRVNFDQFRFDQHWQFCTEFLGQQFDSHWESSQNALKNDHSNKQ